MGAARALGGAEEEERVAGEVGKGHGGRWGAVLREQEPTGLGWDEVPAPPPREKENCLLYTSDAADDYFWV